MFRLYRVNSLGRWTPVTVGNVGPNWENHDHDMTGRWTYLLEFQPLSGRFDISNDTN